MKKYNCIMIVSVLIYLTLALLAGYRIGWDEGEESRQYKVEINRIINSLSGVETLDKLDLRPFKYIEDVELLLDGEKEAEQTGEFVQDRNGYRYEIRPWHHNGQFLGWLRFDYRAAESDWKRALTVVQTSLLLMEIFVLILMFYLKKRLIYPFYKMSAIPAELARGHLKGQIKEEKSKFFGQFLWGISQLKDTLDVTRKRELELEREKKRMLLSLSHDIKTPLNAIKLYGKALEEDMYETDIEQKRAARKIGEKARQIEQFVEEIMRTSREDILDIQVEAGEFYLKELMDRVLDTYREKCTVRMLELQVGQFDNRLLSGDIDRACEVLENLFENAFKYGDGRRMEISFYEEDYCQLIRVFNTGTSITDNDINHIFESFFRGANSEGESGSGLGLYICREIMRKMQGEIFVQREEEGMAFILVFR